MKCVFNFSRLNTISLIAAFCMVCLQPLWAETVSIECPVENRSAIRMTVYSGDLTMIEETRTAELVQGDGVLRVTGIPTTVLPETVAIESLSQGEAFSVYEQNYEHNILTPQNLLEAYTGKEIKILQWNEYQDRKEILSARLLSADGPVYEIDGQIYIGYPGQKVLPGIPEAMNLKPQFIWHYQNPGKTQQDFSVSYLARGLSWGTDYVLNIKEDQKADLTAWVTVHNQSGVEYSGVDLTLIAGDLHRVPQNRVQPRMFKAVAYSEAMSAGADVNFNEESFSDYHLYHLPRHVDLDNSSSKQLNLYRMDDIQIQRIYRVEASSGYYLQQSSGGANSSVPVQVIYKLNNNEESGMGQPLPAGVVRIYSKDGMGRRQYAGEDRMAQTAVDEEAEIQAGNAFDLVAEKDQTDYKQLSAKLYQTAWEIRLKNRLDRDVEVEWNENLFGSWTVLDSSEPYEKIKSDKIRFRLKVPAKGTVTAHYRVQTGL
ncbi:MAG: hypothetical protein H6757_02705 [Candidatus Omnitrophica bacterium]|nr:hypothetical protein [Candidatus Omnitrophota bacterium]